MIKTGQTFTGLMLSFSLFLQGSSFTSTASEKADIQNFAGNWISYNAVSLEAGKPVDWNEIIRLTISEDEFSVNDESCRNPVYSVKESTLTEFMGVFPRPKNTVEIHNENIQLINTGCKDLEPATLAKVNQRTLGVVIGSDLIFLEKDQGVSSGDMDVESGMIIESNLSPFFEMHAQIPYLSKLENKEFNKVSRNLVIKETDGFRNNILDREIPDEMVSYRSFMWIGYEVPYLDPNMISIRFAVDFYVAGAAHPNHYFKVLTYDLKKQKEVGFDDLFVDTGKALPVLAEICKTSLEQKLDFLFDEGFEPKKENFSNWNLTPDGLLISFDPYMVAPYASGPQEVVIPVDKIKDLLNRNSPAGAILAR